MDQNNRHSLSQSDIAGKGRLLLAIALWVLTFILMEIGFHNDRLLVNADFRYFLSIVLIIEYVWALITWVRNGNSFFSITGIFLVYLAFSMAGQSFTGLFASYTSKLPIDFDAYSRGGPEYVCKMLLYQINIVPALMIGIMLGDSYFKRTKRHKVDMLQSDPKATRSNSNIFIYIVFVVLFVVLFSHALQAVMARTEMSYGEYYNSDDKNIVSTYALFAFSCLFVYAVVASKNKTLSMMVYVGIAVLIVMYMMAGTRSRAIPYFGLLIALYFGFTRKKKKIKHKWIYVLLLIAGIEVLGYVSYSRGASFGENALTDYLEKGQFTNVLDMIYEMGISSQTINVTIHAIEEGMAYQFTFLYYFLISFIPGPILSLVGFSAPEVGTLSVWATEYVGMTSGLGYSFIAECFVNFGHFGFLMAMLYGFAMNTLEKVSLDRARRGYILFPCVMLTILSKTIFSARCEFSIFNAYIRLAFYCFIAYTAYSLVVHKGKIIIKK